MLINFIRMLVDSTGKKANNLERYNEKCDWELHRFCLFLLLFCLNIGLFNNLLIFMLYLHRLCFLRFLINFDVRINYNVPPCGGWRYKVWYKNSGCTIRIL